MIYIGEFREEFGEKYKPTKECISDSPIPEKKLVLNYIKRGKIAAASSVRLNDVITGEQISREALYYTDGQYAWRSDLCYYFDKYNFILPQAFIDHVIRNIKLNKLP